MKRAVISLAVLLLLTHLVAAVPIRAAGPPSAGEMAYRVFLPVVLRLYRPPQACLPRFIMPEELVLQLDRPPGLDMVHTGDLNGDGWIDLVIARLEFGTIKAFEIDILLNDGNDHLEDGTLRLFSGPVPKVQHARELVVADFSGDGRADIFIANEGQDAPPFPGYQNTLILSSSGGRLVDATSNLPQRYDETHSATAADIDADGDVDLYVGNLGGGGVPPDILVNDGTGRFQVGFGLLPAAQRDLSENWYTASEFADVNRDGFPDLILGQGDPDRDSHVLLNDGTGHFTKADAPLPPTIFAPSQQILDIKASDLDSDGYLDLMLLDTRNSYVGRYIQILINNGDATFKDETSLRLPQAVNWDVPARFINVLDLDYDGDVDIVGELWAGEGHPFYVNEGWGYFRPWDTGFEIHSHVFALVDITGDGRRDIVRGWSSSEGEPERYHLLRDAGCALVLGQ